MPLTEPGFLGLLSGDHEASIRTPATCRDVVVHQGFTPHPVRLWFADRSPHYASGAVEPRSAAVRTAPARQVHVLELMPSVGGEWALDVDFDLCTKPLCAECVVPRSTLPPFLGRLNSPLMFLSLAVS
jgi:hypothetical protein